MRSIIGALLVPLLLASPAFGKGKSVSDATATDKKEAGDLFADAMKKFDDDDLETALQGFNASYDKVASPNSRFMIARTLARLGRNVEAYVEIEAAIAEAEALGEKYEDTASAARSKREEIRSRIGLLTVTLPPKSKGYRVTVGDEPLDPAKLGKPIAVLPGETRVTTAGPGGKEQTQKVTLEAGASATVDASIAAEPPEPVVVTPNHPKYLLDLGVHVAGEMMEAADRVNRGAGVGGRVALELLNGGLIGGVDDGVAAGVAGEWIGTSVDRHTWLRATVEWNLWLMPELSVLLEPGAALVLGAGTETHVSPVVLVGARFQVWKKLSIVGRIGIPSATLGASWFL